MTVPQPFLVFDDLDSFEYWSDYFEGCPFTGVCPMFYSGLDWVCGFGTGDQRGEVLFSSHHIKGTEYPCDLSLLMWTLITG